MTKMELLEKISTPAFNLKYSLKHCWACKSWKPISEFHKNGSRRDGYSSGCKICHKILHCNYLKSEKGRLANLRASKKYKSSEKGIVAGYRFRAKPEQREYIKIKNREWWIEHPNYKKERYHCIQDEANCHNHLDTFYPGYSFLKALENAPIVEIEVG